MGIPTTVPSSITAGDTVAWQIALADYPASAGWSLSYRLINALGKIDITSAAAGDDHLVNVSAATSAAWVAGDYDLLGVVTKAAERYTVSTGRVTIKPNLAALTTYDGRTPERIALEALQSAYIDYLSNGQGHVAEYEIAGRRMKFRNAAEIWQQIEKLKREVAQEDQAARLAAGLPSRRRVTVRFGG
mgnify:CR=1 FL=1